MHQVAAGNPLKQRRNFANGRAAGFEQTVDPRAQLLVETFHRLGVEASFQIASGSAADQGTDRTLGVQFGRPVHPLADRAQPLAAIIDDRIGDDVVDATTDFQFALTGATQFTQCLQRSRRILIKGADIAAHKLVDREVGLLLTQAGFDLAQRGQQAFVGVKNRARIIGNPQIGRNAIQRNPDAQVVIANAHALRNIEALLNLHRLQALQDLAHFVIARNIDVTGEVTIRQRLEGRNHRFNRTRDQTNNGRRNQ